MLNLSRSALLAAGLGGLAWTVKARSSPARDDSFGVLGRRASSSRDSRSCSPHRARGARRRPPPRRRGCSRRSSWASARLPSRSSASSRDRCLVRSIASGDNLGSSRRAASSSPGCSGSRGRRRGRDPRPRHGALAVASSAAQLGRRHSPKRPVSARAAAPASRPRSASARARGSAPARGSRRRTAGRATSAAAQRDGLAADLDLVPVLVLERNGPRTSSGPSRYGVMTTSSSGARTCYPDSR